jgi:hypothetical protein
MSYPAGAWELCGLGRRVIFEKDRSLSERCNLKLSRPMLVANFSAKRFRRDRQKGLTVNRAINLSRGRATPTSPFKTNVSRDVGVAPTINLPI